MTRQGQEQEQEQDIDGLERRSMTSSFEVSILDYGAGNVRSLRNAIRHLGFSIRDISSAEDIHNAQAIIFPGQGCFHQAMQSLTQMGVVDALKDYIKRGRPFFGICLGMQLLFEASEESPGVRGLGIIPGVVTKFQVVPPASVPQIAWNGCARVKESSVLEDVAPEDMVYFVHSYCALPIANNLEWVLSLTDYGGQRFISMIQKGNVVAAQFHPEKSGKVGLHMLCSFLKASGNIVDGASKLYSIETLPGVPRTNVAKRVIACLDVRSNDEGDLIVTKGDQYDVREPSSGARGGVRNLGKPVALCQQYYFDGADEVVFLNITSFRQGVIDDLPMLQVLEAASENVFVPLTVGGGIREYTDEQGRVWNALDVASRYFRAGADKISIGSDAVFAAEEYIQTRVKTGKTSIELISGHYGAQAVVVSIDPKRVYVSNLPPRAAGDSLAHKTIIELPEGDNGPNGEKYCWWQVTVKGGREAREIDAVQLAQVCEILGAGELMLNCIDMDGQKNGYDISLIRAVQNAVTIPVIASSGAGNASHFVQVFEKTSAQAALAAGIFHRKEETIQNVKSALLHANIPSRAVIV